ncbi:MAG: two-component system, OmpR family, alkaline phosphatase synthesis response regulator PhoP [Candidatus Poribacteria bacterium]|nr:two-component system, OmpR family, alkaline phosphatase synthesis response regulator PhoP [Candidatus Poribacteria bacterium]
MGKGKILIVDDDVEITETVATMLRLRGFEVITAFDGGEGLIKARSEKPDVILLDIEMPLMNGIEVCAKLKADKTTMKIPVVTSYEQGEIESIAKADQVGANDFILKPFSLKDLLIKLNRYLARINCDKIGRSNYWSRIMLACFIYIVSNAFDYYMTVFGIINRKAQEGNIIIQQYINFFGLHNGVLIYKIFMCSLIILAIIIFSLIYEYKGKKRIIPECILYSGSFITLIAVTMWLRICG